jgi:hypothetical protein
MRRWAWSHAQHSQDGLKLEVQNVKDFEIRKLFE